MMKYDGKSKNILYNILGFFTFLILFLLPINAKAAEVGDFTDFGYSGGVQKYTVPDTGYYQLEVWGAQGGNANSYHGGYGGYATGASLLRKGEEIYVVVGGQGATASTGSGKSFAGGYNGGGYGYQQSGSLLAPGGGGATHIATQTGTLYSLKNYRNQVLIVAGGGSGAYGYSNKWWHGNGGGGYIGGYSYNSGNAGNQTTGYDFGRASDVRSGADRSSNHSGGGGGYFGGKASWGEAGSGGGSGFINSAKLISYDNITKSMYCYSCATSTAKETYTVRTTSVSGSEVSKYEKTDSGAARITLMKKLDTDARLSSINISGATLDQEFDPDTYEYNVYLDSENTPVTISATTIKDTTTVVGTGTFDIYVGDTDITLTGTAEAGDTKIYTLHISRPASGYKYLNGITVDGDKITNFDPETLEYTVNVKYDQEEVELGTIFGRPSQIIDGTGKIKVPSGNSTTEIQVTSEDKQSTTKYIIHFVKEHSSKLKSLKIENYELDPTFDPNTNEYIINIMNSTLSLEVEAIAYDEEATISLDGFGYIKTSTTGTITVSEPNCSPTTYKVQIIKGGISVPVTTEFPYKGTIDTFIAPVAGYYRLETWGAQGGYANSYRGGFGGYSTGVVFLQKDEKLYIVVGGQGATANVTGSNRRLAGGYNGGGYGYQRDSSVKAGAGGGATHIATQTGLLSTLNNSKDSILIVSGGGAGGYGYSNKWWNGNSGGGYHGGYSYSAASAGTQTSGYAFGQASDTSSVITLPGTNHSGGGGGYYGGLAYWGETGAGGGSGYIGNKDLVSFKDITKVMYCYSCKTSDNESIYTVNTGNVSTSPTSYYAKAGSGYARITLMGQPSENNFLSSITTSVGTLNPTFDMTKTDYKLDLTSEDDEITINARLEDDTAKMTGTGTFDVPAGTTDFPITVTAEDGSIRIYTITVTRPASSNEKPNNIIISGLVPSLCQLNENYCNLDNEFDPDIHEYTMTVPSRIKQLQFTVIKGHKFQTVTGDGVANLDGGMNIIVIEITSEDGTNTATYTYNIERDMTGNANIEELKVIDPEMDIQFDPDLTEYYFSVPNDYTEIGLEVTLEDPEATYRILGNGNFEVGLNAVTIEVTAQNGEKKDYTLNIYREQSGNTFLSNLTVSHDTQNFPLNPKFNKILSTYTVNVDNEITEVDINATAEHSLTKITGLGTKTLQTGTNTFDVTSTSEDGSVQIYTVSVIRAKNSDATLKTLDVLESTITPQFISTTFDYYVDVNPGVTSLNINAVPTMDTSTYTITGNSEFKVGNNNAVKITVKAENGNTQNYTIHVNRLASTNTYLSELTTDKYDMTPVFDKEKTEYNIELENDVNQIKISAIPEDKLSTVTGTGTYNLKTGMNDIAITVLSESGSAKVYTLHVFRKYNSNANLLSLTTTSNIDINPAFDKNTTSYTLDVDSTEDKITILGVAEEKTATVTGNGEYELKTGNNPIKITVTAEDGTEKEYTINVNKAASSNANASMIIAKESVLDPVFDKNTTSYVLKVIEGVTSLSLSVTLEDEAATYEIIGNENFKIGNNTVIIKVTAEDGTIKNYELNVLRQKAGTTSNRLSWLKTDKGNLTPQFNPDTTYYEVELPYSNTSITLTGELEDKNATVQGLGEYQLELGQNVLGVEVTSVENIVRYYQVVVTRKANDEARLANLQVQDTTLNPNFNKDTFEYNLTTTNTDLTITASTIDPNATYEVIGNQPLTLGENQIIVRVTAQDKVTTKDYILNIEKEKSNNNNLKLLEVEGQKITPTFSKTTTVYYLDVERNTETIQVIAEPEDINATVTGDGEVDLNVGTNFVEVIVTSESGKTKAYTIIVNRKGNSNNYLADLTVSEGSLNPIFEKTVNEYTVSVPYETETITVSGRLEDSNATVTGFDTYNLEVGKNEIPVTVVAEDGTTNIYTITVTREEIVSSKLANLKVSNYDIQGEFNSDVFDYNVTVDNEITSLDITAIPIDKGAKIEILGNENFIVGMNTVTINVTDRLDQTTSTYILNVNRQNYANTYLAYIYPSKGNLTPNFDKTNLSYTVTVDYNIESIDITAEPEVESNILTGTGTHKLEPGDNIIPLVVTTQTGISRTYYVNVVRSLRENSHLTSLTVKANGENQTLTPAFDENTQSYTVNVPAGTANVQIAATAEESATITGIGNKTISIGENNFDIVVTAENGTTRTYKLTVNREASNNNNLINIIPSTGQLTPSFSYTNNEYSLKLDSGASLLSFSVITEDRFAKVSGHDKAVVPDGESTRQIVVTAEDGSEKIYTIHVYKDRTDEARLSSLSISGFQFNETFDPDTFHYTLTVPKSKQVVLSNEVTAIAMDSNATVTKTSSLLLSSSVSTLYTVVVTAKDGFTKQTYTIEITKEKGNDATLSKLIFDYGTLSPTFASSNTEYTLVVPNNIDQVRRGDVVAIPTDDDAEVTVPYIYDFNTAEDDLFEITVVSADKTTTKTYTIHLEKEQSNDASLKEITLSEGTLEPELTKNVLDYTINVRDNLDEIKIGALVNDDKATILNGPGTYSLDNDSQTINIVVQAEDGTIKIYNLNIVKSLTTQKYLDDLYLEGDCTKDTCPLNPTFNETTFSYKTSVDYEIKTVDIKAIKKHENQIVKYYDENDKEISEQNISLKVGTTTLRVEVINGIDEKTNYTIAITRKPSSNNYLETLKITNVETDLEFEKETTEYFVTIPHGYEEINLEYTTEDPDATVVTSGTTHLQVGNNDVYVTVTAPNGQTRTYIIHVVRDNEYNIYLKSLTVSSGSIKELTPKFAKTTFDYTLTLPDAVEVVTVDGIAEDDTTKVSGNGEYKLETGINTITITTTAANGESANYNIVINRLKSTHLYLTSLTPKVGSLNETFQKTNLSYTMDVDSTVQSIDFDVIPELASTKYKIIGNQNLVTGKNLILIVLTNEDNTITTTYRVEVTKGISTDNYLKSLKVDGEELIDENNKEQTTFDITVSSDKDKIDIEAIANSSTAQIVGDGTHSLEYGNNKIQITVTSEDGQTRIYIVNIQREHDNNLLMISTDRGELTPTFNPDTLDYYLDVEKDIEDITVLAVQSSPLTTVTGNGYYPLEIGENLIDITVTSSDGAYKTYTLHINRKLSNNNYLEELFVYEGSLPDFEKTKQNYDIEVPFGTQSLTITAKPEDPNATYTIVGNQNLVTGDNTVKIIVTAEDKSERIYTLNVIVQEEAEYSNKLQSLTVNKGTLTPVFDPDNISYTVTVPNDTKDITVNGVLESVSAKVTGFGTYQLNTGDNMIQIVVTSKDQKTRTYSVLVVREKSSDARLRIVQFDDGTLSPIFDKDIENYTMNISSSVTSLEEYIEPLVDGTTYQITNNKNIQAGTTVITIKATAEDGQTTKTYTIRIRKLAPEGTTPNVSDNPNTTNNQEPTNDDPNAENPEEGNEENKLRLSYLMIDDAELMPAFDSEIFEYSLYVTNKESLNVPENITYDKDNRLILIVPIENPRPMVKLTVHKTGERFTEVAQDSVTYKTGDNANDNRTEKRYTPVFKEQPLPGVVFNVVTTERVLNPIKDGTYVEANTIVDTITTNAEGNATTIELFPGTYKLVEIKAPNGYIANDNIEPITLTNDGKETPVKEFNVDLANDRQRLGLTFPKSFEKVKFITGEKVEQKATFAIYANEDIVTYDGKVKIPKDGLVDLVEIEGNDNVTSKIDLPEGKYYAKEVYVSYPYTPYGEKIEFSLVYNNNKQPYVVIEGKEIINTYETSSISLIKISSSSMQSVVMKGKEIDKSKLDEEISKVIEELNGKTEEQVKQYLKDNKIITVAGATYGIYTDAECKNILKILNEEYGQNLTIIAVIADKNIRYQRLSERIVRPHTKDEAINRDLGEIENMDKGGPIAYADYFATNNGTVEELEARLKEILDNN